MNVIFVLVSLFLVMEFSFSNNEPSANYQLLYLLNDDLGWELIEQTNDSIYISNRKIKKSHLNAIKVEKKINLDPNIIKDIIMDVNGYSSIFSNNTIKSKVVESLSSGLIAYQKIIIDVPFFDDREYYFKLFDQSFVKQDNSILCYWFLLDPKPINMLKGITYLRNGAGLWKWNLVDSQEMKISYILYIDPGGIIPRFLIEILNKHSIIDIFRNVLKEAEIRKKIVELKYED